LIYALKKFFGKQMRYENELKTLSKKFLYANFKKLGIKRNDTIYLGLDLKIFTFLFEIIK